MEHLSTEISVPSHGYKGLTRREVEVLKWSAEGKTAAEVAIILDVKQRTVNFHISSAMRKIGVNNKTSAVVHAALQGLFQPRTGAFANPQKPQVQAAENT